ncbi:hypothetical protein Lal_00001057 [Lupinus albus]|nr:hypothetical protein Lal_00001057 [Lupinus albus]
MATPPNIAGTLRNLTISLGKNLAKEAFLVVTALCLTGRTAARRGRGRSPAARTRPLMIIAGRFAIVQDQNLDCEGRRRARVVGDNDRGRRGAFKVEQSTAPRTQNLTHQSPTISISILETRDQALVLSTRDWLIGRKISGGAELFESRGRSCVVLLQHPQHYVGLCRQRHLRSSQITKMAIQKKVTKRFSSSGRKLTMRLAWQRASRQMASPPKSRCQYRLAKEKGYRARAAFKLIQINKKYGFLERSRVVLDLCAAPECTPQGALLLGVDLDRIKPIPRAITWEDDIKLLTAALSSNST